MKTGASLPFHFGSVMRLALDLIFLTERLDALITCRGELESELRTPTSNTNPYLIPTPILIQQPILQQQSNVQPFVPDHLHTLVFPALRSQPRNPSSAVIFISETSRIAC
jgi:hypothetical protein